MSAKYWVAKYVEDPFRNEPRNVGIFVSTEDGVAARFAGERDDGSVDGRRIQSFKYADVYKQWLQYWREQIEEEGFDEIVNAATPNYYVVYGGEVTDIGSDSADRVCRFLYNLIVSDVAVLEAFELATEGDTERALSLDVDITFREWDVLGDNPNFAIRHPIRRKQPVRGSHATHEPSFSQQNGKLFVFEAIDFNTQKPKLLRERAGFMAYMFSDIRHEMKSDMEAYSIVRPATNGIDEDSIQYARALLDGESNIVNWADQDIRDQFLRERRTVAESLQSAPHRASGSSGPTGPAGPPLMST